MIAVISGEALASWPAATTRVTMDLGTAVKVATITTTPAMRNNKRDRA